MNTYLISYQGSEDKTLTGTASLVAADNTSAADLFHHCYDADEPMRIITAMTRVFVGGVRVDEDVPCYPPELGGGPVDLTYKPDHLEADIEEGREIMQELLGVPEELR